MTMGMLHTNLNNTPVWDWHELCDVPAAMLAALNNVETFTNIPVDNAADRPDTSTVHQGTVLYNKDTDLFEYWDGTAWRRVNHDLNMPASFRSDANPNVSRQGAGYYDFKYVLTPQYNCQVVLFAAVTATVDLTPSTWQGLQIQTLCDDDVAPIGCIDNSSYPNKNSSARLNAFCTRRYILTPGRHVLGVRSSPRASTPAITITGVELVGIRVSADPSTAGTNAHGIW